MSSNFGLSVLSSSFSSIFTILGVIADERDEYEVYIQILYNFAWMYTYMVLHNNVLAHFVLHNFALDVLNNMVL